MFPSRAGYGGYGPNNFIAERILIAVGAALITISPYLPWLHVVILGDFNLTGLLSAGHWIVALAYLVSGIGVALLLVAVLGRSMEAVRVTALAIGSVLLLLGGDATYGLVRAVSKSAGLGQVGVGPIMAVVGSVLLIVPPIVGYAQRPLGSYAPGPLWRSPRWLPAVGGVVVAMGLVWVPFHAGVGNYCGTPVGASFKSPTAMPSDTPPPAVTLQLTQDQSAVAAAQSAINSDASSSAATQQQNNADALSSQAQQADTNAQNVQDQVYSDQSAVGGDQGSISGDQATVSADQNTVGLDQSQLQSAQQQLASDQANGFDTSFDQTEISTDQQTLNNDQATLAKDQGKLQTDQAALNQAQSRLSSDQNSLNAAQTKATNLDQQAQQASSDALNAADNAASAQASDQSALDDAQAKLQTDQQAWQDTYEGELTSAHAYNTALDQCQSQANGHFLAAVILAALGGIITALLLFRRPRGQQQTMWPPMGSAY